MFPDTQTSRFLAKLVSKSGTTIPIRYLKGVTKPVLHIRALEIPKKWMFTHPGGFDGGVSRVGESLQVIKSKH